MTTVSFTALRSFMRYQFVIKMLCRWALFISPTTGLKDSILIVLNVQVTLLSSNGNNTTGRGTVYSDWARPQNIQAGDAMAESWIKLLKNSFAYRIPNWTHEVPHLTFCFAEYWTTLNAKLNMQKIKSVLFSALHSSQISIIWRSPPLLPQKNKRN